MNIPIKYDSPSFPRALEKELNSIVNKIKFMPDGVFDKEARIKNINEFKGILLQTVTLYYHGKSGDAYKLLTEILSEKVANYKFRFVKSIIKGTTLFRARIEQPDQIYTFDRDAMFHIPFECRTKVKNNRFSISGLPCLYMCGSAYTCWLELEKPTLDRLTISSMCVSDNIKVFDLCKIYDDYISNPQDFIANYGEFLLLLCACSFVVKNKHDEFKPEYIVPQFIMQWLLDNKYEIKGIKYYTIHTQVNHLHPRLYSNYVFPVVEINDKGFCHFLKSKFEIQRIVSGRILQYVKQNSSLNFISSIKDIDNSESIHVADGCSVRYDGSMFGFFEHVLSPKTNNLNDGTYCIVEPKKQI